MPDFSEYCFVILCVLSCLQERQESWLTEGTIHMEASLWLTLAVVSSLRDILLVPQVCWADSWWKLLVIYCRTKCAEHNAEMQIRGKKHLQLMFILACLQQMNCSEHVNDGPQWPPGGIFLTVMATCIVTGWEWSWACMWEGSRLWLWQASHVISLNIKLLRDETEQCSWLPQPAAHSCHSLCFLHTYHFLYTLSL